MVVCEKKNLSFIINLLMNQSELDILSVGCIEKSYVTKYILVPGVFR